MDFPSGDPKDLADLIRAYPLAWLVTCGAEGFDATPLPLIAEDLGIITADVEALRDAYGLPGMKVLQFAFGGDGRHAYLPHNYTTPNCCVYTGTHDNDTALGWWQALPETERRFASAYLGLGAHDDANAPWALVRAAWSSIASVAICQLQDVLGLDARHRMNTPGRLGAWTWRFRWEQVGPDTGPVQQGHRA